MTNYELDVDYPYTINRVYGTDEPATMEYSQRRIRFRHYGKIVEDLIKQAVASTDQDLRETLVVQIANQMKKSFQAWNKNVVNDDIILNDLTTLSGGRLEIPGCLTTKMPTTGMPAPAPVPTRNPYPPQAPPQQRQQQAQSQAPREAIKVVRKAGMTTNPTMLTDSSRTTASRRHHSNSARERRVRYTK